MLKKHIEKLYSNLGKKLCEYIFLDEESVYGKLDSHGHRKV